MPPMTTWLVRHGQSTNNAGLPTFGNTDVPLTDLGIEQGRVVADRVWHQPDLLVVSPFLRARATAQFISKRWPDLAQETWPIQELTYLSPVRCLGTTVHTRQPLVDAYWSRCDPDYADGNDAESFAAFLQRIHAFHRSLYELDAGFVVAVGHGQFFRAYMLALQWGFVATPEWMRGYRAAEIASAMANGEIIEVNASGERCGDVRLSSLCAER